MQAEKRKLVQQWVANATEDLQLAKEIISNNRPYYRAAVYHCQQSAEFILKGFLILNDQDPTMSHNLRTLAERVKALRPELSSKLTEADYLTQFNQTYRYPGSPTEDRTPTPGELKKAFRIAKEVYTSVVDAMPQEVVIKKQSQSQQSQQQSTGTTNLQALWNKYSEGLDPQRPVERTKAVIRAALQDKLSEDTIASVLEHDPHTQKVKREQGADKATEYIKRLFRSVTYEQQQSSQSQQTKPNRRENDQGLGL